MKDEDEDDKRRAGRPVNFEFSDSLSLYVTRELAPAAIPSWYLTNKYKMLSNFFSQDGKCPIINFLIFQI